MFLKHTHFGRVEIMPEDIPLLASTIERVMTFIEKAELGSYDYALDGFNTKLAFQIVSNMDEWQTEINKLVGIKSISKGYVSFSIIDKKQHELSIDEAIANL